ncbi:hypothetical protein L7F22_029195 [Adiantum nelumboides]|nr:hypothetical protein [Adiantum nelumboides]
MREARLGCDGTPGPACPLFSQEEMKSVAEQDGVCCNIPSRAHGELGEEELGLAAADRTRGHLRGRRDKCTALWRV